MENNMVLSKSTEIKSDSTSGKIVFISHSHYDKEVAEFLKDFLVALGIPSECITCSSLPGNDLDSDIPRDVKQNLKKSKVNIIILSQNYYESAFCVNEEGIIWYLEDEAEIIVIGLPEINPQDMIGFIDKNKILRRLDCDTDIAHIYDIIQNNLNVPQSTGTTILAETNKLKNKYNQYLSCRKLPPIKEDKIIEVNTVGVKFIGLLADVVLLYAVENDGTIEVDKGLGGATFVVGSKYNMNSSQDNKEIAKWDEVIRNLEERQLIQIENTGSNNRLYKVNYKGYQSAESFKDLNHLDVRKTPQEIIREFME